MENNELYHTGVKGMKWGVRRALKKAKPLSVKKANKMGTPELAGKRVLATKKEKKYVEVYNKALVTKSKKLNKAINKYSSSQKIAKLKQTQVSAGKEAIRRQNIMSKRVIRNSVLSGKEKPNASELKAVSNYKEAVKLGRLALYTGMIGEIHANEKFRNL